MAAAYLVAGRRMAVLPAVSVGAVGVSSLLCQLARSVDGACAGPAGVAGAGRVVDPGDAGQGVLSSGAARLGAVAGRLRVPREPALESINGPGAWHGAERFAGDRVQHDPAGCRARLARCLGAVAHPGGSGCPAGASRVLVDGLAPGAVAGHALLFHLPVALATGRRPGVFRPPAPGVLGGGRHRAVAAAWRSFLSSGRRAESSLAGHAKPLGLSGLAVAGFAGGGAVGAGGASQWLSRSSAGKPGAGGSAASQQESPPGRMPEGGCPLRIWWRAGAGTGSR